MKAKRAFPWWLIPASLFALGIAGWAIHVVYEEARLASADVATTCTVIKVNRDDDDEGRSARAQVTIAHEVGGKRYERLDEGVDHGFTRDADADLAPFRVGADVPCRYVRGRPDLVVVLTRRKSMAMYIALAIFWLAFPFALYLFDRWLVKRRQGRGAKREW